MWKTFAPNRLQPADCDNLMLAPEKPGRTYETRRSGDSGARDVLIKQGVISDDGACDVVMRQGASGDIRARNAPMGQGASGDTEARDVCMRQHVSGDNEAATMPR